MAQKIKAMRYVANLTGRDKMNLYELMRTSLSFNVRQRAHAILLSAKRRSIDEIAEIFDVDRDTVSEWFKRWERGGIEALKDAPRPGRPVSKNKRMKESVSSTKTGVAKM